MESGRTALHKNIAYISDAVCFKRFIIKSEWPTLVHRSASLRASTLMLPVSTDKLDKQLTCIYSESLTILGHVSVFVCLFVCLASWLAVGPSVRPSVCPFLLRYFHPSIYLFLYLFTYLSICLPNSECTNFFPPETCATINKTSAPSVCCFRLPRALTMSQINIFPC